MDDGHTGRVVSCEDFDSDSASCTTPNPLLRCSRVATASVGDEAVP